MLRSAGIETTNLYTGFLSLIMRLLDDGAQMVAITPRSFCNGPYFRPFREDVLSHLELQRIHVFESRQAAFRDNNVLQENIIFHAVKSRHQPRELVISSSSGQPGAAVTETVFSFAEIVHPKDVEKFIHIPSTSSHGEAKEILDGLSSTLATNAVTYYWAKEHNPEVTCKVTVNGKPVEAKTTFEVRKPNVTVSLTPKHPVAITNRCDGAGAGLLCGRGLACGTNFVGMYFGFEVTEWKGFEGGMNLSFARLVSSKEKENFAALTNVSRFVETPYVYDLNYPNFSWVATKYLDELFSYTDSPGAILDGRASFLYREDSFKEYLLFTPSGGKPVPLVCAEWNWAGKVRLKTNSVSEYEFVVPATNPAASVGQSCDTPPTWTNNIAVMRLIIRAIGQPTISGILLSEP